MRIYSAQKYDRRSSYLQFFYNFDDHAYFLSKVTGRSSGRVTPSMSDSTGNSDGILDEDLETAAFHNRNLDFVRDWLMRFAEEEITDKEVYAKRRGRLLRRACYYHSVDVVMLILQPEKCAGEFTSE